VHHHIVGRELLLRRSRATQADGAVTVHGERGERRLASCESVPV
jgi:hypothetical protein